MVLFTSSSSPALAATMRSLQSSIYNKKQIPAGNQLLALKSHKNLRITIAFVNFIEILQERGRGRG